MLGNEAADKRGLGVTRKNPGVLDKDFALCEPTSNDGKVARDSAEAAGARVETAGPCKVVDETGKLNADRRDSEADLTDEAGAGGSAGEIDSVAIEDDCIANGLAKGMLIRLEIVEKTGSEEAKREISGTTLVVAICDNDGSSTDEVIDACGTAVELSEAASDSEAVSETLMEKADRREFTKVLVV